MVSPASSQYYKPKFEYCHTTTSDDHRIYCKRYPQVGAPPVVMVHGLAQNMQSFDLPVPGHSMAVDLHRAGFDVWLPNLRSHGRPPLRSQCSGQWDWSIDDYALRDLPAIISMITQQTGHSMGGMALLIYLQGAYYTAEGRVRRSAELTDQRHGLLAGGITLGSPIVLKWRTSGVLRWLASLAHSRNVIQLLGNQRWLLQLLLALRQAPTRRLTDELADSGRLHWISLRKLMHLPGMANRMLAHGHIWNPNNMTDSLFKQALRCTMSHCCARVLVQFLDWISHGAFREFPVPGANDLLDYQAGLPHITLPLLMVAGEHDHFTDSQVLRMEGYSRLGSADKSLVQLANTGHADILYGRNVPTALYPMLAAWIKKRCVANDPPRASQIPRFEPAGTP